MALNNLDFIRRVVAWPSDDQQEYINVHYAGKDSKDGHPWMSGKPTNSPQQFLETVYGILQWKTPTDIYFCLSRQRATQISRAGKVTAAKSQENAVALKSIWLDIDVGKTDSYATRDEALTALGAFLNAANLPPPSAMVGSGGGLHVYFISDRELTRAEWQPYANGLKALAIKHELLCDAMCTADSARILRVPGTFNRKKDPPRPVELLDYRSVTTTLRLISLSCVTWILGALRSPSPQQSVWKARLSLRLQGLLRQASVPVSSTRSGAST